MAMYVLNFDDPSFPKIVRLPQHPLGMDEREDVLAFGEAKRQLLEYVRNKRDHWAAQLRACKALTEKSVEMK